MVLLLFLTIYLYVSFFVVLKLEQKGFAVIAALACFSRLIMCLAGLFIVLPFGGDDAQTFERIAADWSQGSFAQVLATFDLSRSYVFSSVIAVFYWLLEVNIAIPVFINGIAGVLIFYFAMILAGTVWPTSKNNLIFGLLVALHPMLNVDSAITLRENLIILFLVMSAFSLVSYIKYRSLKHLFLYMLLAIFSAFFHGAIVIFIAGLPLYLIFFSGSFSYHSKVFVALAFSGCLFLFLFYADLGKVEVMQEEGFSVETLAEVQLSRKDAATVYLQGVVPDNVFDIVWQTPLRVVNFLFQPFPWRVTDPRYIMVFFDAILWVFIISILIRNIRHVSQNKAALALLVSAFVLVVVFSYGTGNFGTAIRHRTKFLVLFLVVVYPFLPNFSIRRSKNT